MAAATSVVATSVGGGTVDLTWAAPAPDCTGPPTYYAIYAYPQQTINPIRVTAGSTFTWTGLTSGAPVTLTLTAYDGIRWSPWSAWSAWTVPT